jgi:wobble nucleotide-excising tRNase
MATAVNRIEKLKNIGSFNDFSAPKNSEFGDVNLLYGYNGSGKTTLTRVFQCLNDGVKVLSDNDGEPLVDFTGGEINIQCNTEAITDFAATNIKDKVKVFNADFVEKNLKLKAGKASKLSAVIGAHNIAVKNKITELEKSKAELYTTKKELKAQLEANRAINSAEDIKSDVAAEIRTYLHIDNANSYNVRHFKSDLGKYTPASTPLTEADKKAAGEIYLAEVKPEINGNYGAALDNLGSMLALENYTTIFDLLKTPIKREAAKIKEEVIKWIEEGSALHTDDHDICKFCGQSISAETWNTRLAEIQVLIKKDDKFEELEKRLAATKQSVARYIQRLTSSSWELTETHFFTPKLFAEYQTARTAFDTAHTYFSTALGELAAAVEEKEKNKDSEKPFDGAEEFKNKVVGLTGAITKLKNAIEANNIAVGKIGELKEEKRKIVIDFCIQQNKAKIEAAEADVKAKTALLETAKQTSQEFDDDIRAKNATLENQEENIKRINDFLKRMLNVGLAFKIEPGAQEYQLERKINGMPNIPAKNLSEGEKNIVAFLYFCVSLDSSSAENKKDEIIVIDDPVSSLDSNNLFALQNLVVKTMKAYGQQFLLTHNFYFFAKVRESIRADRKKNGKNTELKIFEIKNNEETGSLIKLANKYVKSHISEYMSIMEALHEKWKTAPADEEKDVTTGNLIRRALEVFLCFKDTDKDHLLFDKLQGMAGNDVKFQSLLNMGNAFSHTEVGENADFSYAAGKEEIGVLFNFMNEKDRDHFKGFGIKLESTRADAPVVAPAAAVAEA